MFDTIWRRHGRDKSFLSKRSLQQQLSEVRGTKKELRYGFLSHAYRQQILESMLGQPMGQPPGKQEAYAVRAVACIQKMNLRVIPSKVQL